MFLLGYVLLLTALDCTAAPASDGSCSAPPIHEGAVLQGDWDADVYPHNIEATYQCAPGYSRRGSIKYKCLLNGQWKFTGNGECRKKPCGHPGDIPFGSFQLKKEESFIFGAVVEYSCDEGYQMVSKERTRQCTASGWSNYLPECEVRNCPPVEAADNVKVLSTSYDEEYSVGQVVRFECKDPNLKLDSASEIFCTSEGKWNLEPPKCVAISCKLPQVDNGRVNGLKKPVYKNHDVIQITCNEGFNTVKNGEATCTKDGWIPQTTCEEIVCNSYQNVEKGKLVSTKAVYKYGDEIDVECDRGYVLQTEPNKRRTCTSNGWSPPSRCVGKRCDIPDIKNGYLDRNYYFPKDPGQSIYYRCEDNFVTPKKEYWVYITCTEAGWSPEPRCLRACVPSTDYLGNARLINQQNKYLEGEKATFQCHGNYKTPDGKSFGEMSCLPNGKFTPAKCSLKCTAPQLRNGKFRTTKNEFEVGEDLLYECNKGYRTTSKKLSGRIQCVDGRWSDTPFCEVIFCNLWNMKYNNGQIITYTCPQGKKPTADIGQCYYFGFYPLPICQDIECTIPDTSDLILSPHRPSYAINTAVSFSCRKGFSRVGSLESSCTEKGWNPPLPKCQVIMCTIPEDANLIGKSLKPSYQENDRVTLSCGEKKRSSTTTCTKDGWNPPLPICEVTCTISEDANLIRKPTKKSYKENDDVSLICEKGYTQKGSNTTTCSKDGWTPPLPTCEDPDKPDISEPSTDDTEKPAENPTEPVPAAPTQAADANEGKQKCPLAYTPSNAEIIDPKEAYYSNDNVNMRCNRGYKMLGSSVIHCINGRWEQPPECIRLVPCKNPPTINNGNILESSKQDKYVTDDVVKYGCKSGFHISGADQSTCLNGQWTTSPKCTEDPCDEAPDVAHGTVVEKRKIFNHGESAKYICDNGFRISGGDSASCAEGKWLKIPTCVTTSCEPPPAVRNSMLNEELKDSYESGEKVTYTCNRGYSLERSLTGEAQCENTQWINVPVCRKIGEQCGPPPTVQFGDTTGIRKPNYKSGESVEYRCPNYHILKGEKVVRCMNGVWEEAPVCLEPCTAKEKDMEENRIQLRWRDYKKLYSKHGEEIEFACKPGHEAPPGTQMRTACQQGKLQYPKCFTNGFCVLQQATMIANNINSNTSNVVDHGQTIIFQCNEGMMPEDKLEAKCEKRNINYPKCSFAKSCQTPEIVNGFLKTERQDSYDLGSSVAFECNENYVINGPINAKCENGQWTDLPVCYCPCRISSEGLTKSNIQLVSSDDQKSIPDSNYKHGTELFVSCKPGFKRPNQALFKIECYDGKFKYLRCFSGKTCRITQEGLDENNLDLDEVHDNEVLYMEGEKINFKCKSGFYHRGQPTGTCSELAVSYPTCSASSSV
ncbi:complement factor H-like isoform X3 [Eleutherodactylus coqui]|uniref:complement factor H-like isoform X3 n=1 Tax=Eleutherodactylus coqui TaxID=57060 RepID=UPI0034631C14